MWGDAASVCPHRMWRNKIDHDVKEEDMSKAEGFVLSSNLNPSFSWSGWYEKLNGVVNSFLDFRFVRSINVVSNQSFFGSTHTFVRAADKMYCQ